MTQRSDRLARGAFCAALLTGGFTYGYLAHQYGWFPHQVILEAAEGLQMAREEINVARPWYHYETTATEACTIVRAEQRAPGLTLVTGVDADKRQFADVIDGEGNLVHRWVLDWFELWPDATHLDADLVPQSRPGALVNGALITNEGDLIVNFDACGLIAIDACGHVRWRQPLRTHHTLCRDEQGHIWTSVRHRRTEKRPDLPNYIPMYDEYTIVELSPAGEILREISIFDLLIENNLTGLLFMATRQDNDTRVGGDTLHVNDVEVFPADLQPGFFGPGDVMVSMRTINTVAVFDLATRRAKYVSTGRYVRQHDPDFIDGNTISVFDNNNAGRPVDGIQSRIVVEHVPEGTLEVAFAGRPDLPFFTVIIGRHQWLSNGNLLLVESTGGRVLEVDPAGQLVWQYVNLVAPGVAGLLSDGMRLPLSMNAAFFARCRAACEGATRKT